MTTENRDLDAILRRIQKMLAIAQDDRADANEAAAAAAMAEKLMRKYQIEHADVISAELKREENFDKIDVAAVMKRAQGHKPSAVPPWAQWLAVRIAKLHDCGVRTGRNAEVGACLRFYGYRADVQCAAWTFDYLVGATIRAVRAYQHAAKQLGMPRTKAESNSFRHGFVTAMLRSIDVAIAERERENAAASDSRALVVVKQAALAERFGDFNYGKSKSKGPSRGDAFAEGVIEGRKVDVNRRGLEGTTTTGAPLLSR